MYISTTNLLAGVFLLLLQLNPGCEKRETGELQQVQFSGRAQGTTYQVIYLSRDGVDYQEDMGQVLESIDSSLSLYLPGSLINRFNESSRGIVIDDYFRDVVKKGLEVSRESDGAFDMTVKPLVDAWGFGEKRQAVVPDSGLVEELLPLVDYRLLEIKADSLIKKHPAVRIDANGIAQGYTLDVLAAFLEKRKIKNYLVELGGEIRVNGKNLNNKPWRIGIETPPPDRGGATAPGSDGKTIPEKQGETTPQAAPVMKMISLSGKGVSTSGNYRRFFESGGKHYAHTIDPRSGYPVQNRLISVTVVAPDCITADAWDNALMVMGIPAAFEKLGNEKKIEALFVYSDENGRLADTCTAGFMKFYLETN